VLLVLLAVPLIFKLPLTVEIVEVGNISKARALALFSPSIEIVPFPPVLMVPLVSMP
jgi:hypothetical protein